MNKSDYSSVPALEERLQLSPLLENEIDIQSQKHGASMEQGQRENLYSAFAAIQPRTITDLAFVVWCAHKTEPANEYVERYRHNRRAELSQKDCYPYIPLDDCCVPDSAGLFAFREEIAALVSELAACSNTAAMGIALQIYQAGCGVRKNIICRERFQRLLKPEFSERYTLHEIKALHDFISDSVGRSLPYYFCAVLAERALEKLISGCRQDIASANKHTKFFVGANLVFARQMGDHLYSPDRWAITRIAPTV